MPKEVQKIKGKWDLPTEERGILAFSYAQEFPERAAVNKSWHMTLELFRWAICCPLTQILFHQPFFQTLFGDYHSSFTFLKPTVINLRSPPALHCHVQHAPISISPQFQIQSHRLSHYLTWDSDRGHDFSESVDLFQWYRHLHTMKSSHSWAVEVFPFLSVWDHPAGPLGGDAPRRLKFMQNPQRNANS